MPTEHPGDATAIYEYPGRYTELSPGDKIAERRLQEIQADWHRVAAKGTARQLWSGRKFRLELFPREVENDDYFVIKASYVLWDEELRAGQSQDGSGYVVEVDLSPMKVPVPARPAHTETADEGARRPQWWWDQPGPRSFATIQPREGSLPLGYLGHQGRELKLLCPRVGGMGGGGLGFYPDPPYRT